MSFPPIPGFFSNPGAQPSNVKAYLKDAVETLKIAPQANLDAWSKRMCDDVQASNIESVLQDNIVDIATMSYVHPDKLKSSLKLWMEADPTTKHLLKKPQPAAHTLYGLKETDPETIDLGPTITFSDIVEQDGTPVQCHKNDPFANWGDTVSSLPAFTFYPKTSEGVRTIVAYFKDRDARIRAAGTRHSWSDIYNSSQSPSSSTVEVFISMVPKGVALPTKFGTLKPNKRGDEDLESIQIVNVDPSASSATVRLGSAVTSEHFRAWALDEDGGNWEWMLSALPILTAITNAGWTQPICHGSGITHTTVSDLCVRMEIINCRGQRQIIDDPAHLRAASGCFGLLGIVISQDFTMDPLKLCRFRPRLRPTALSVPPLSLDDIPPNADFDCDNCTDADIEKGVRELDEDANRFYSEWFWFPFQKECFLNSWDATERDGTKPQYPDEDQVRADNVQAALAAVLENTVFMTRLLRERGRFQAVFVAKAALLFLPNEDDYTEVDHIPSNVPDTLHFRRGIHRMPVRDFEVSVQVPALPKKVPGDPKEPPRPDMKVVRDLWWAAINAVYEADAKGVHPMRTTLEMRMVGGSNVYMSTQNGNEFSCAIEVLSNAIVPDEEWGNFINDLATRWINLPLVVKHKLQFKPHWAKEWPTVIDGVDINTFLQKAYKDQIPIFLNEIKNIGAAAQIPYSVEDAVGTFGNDTLLSILDVNPKPKQSSLPIRPNQKSKNGRSRGGCFCIGRNTED